MSKRDSTLVLLTLNERSGLERLWDELPLDEFELVVAVDGGSVDGTRRFLSAKISMILDQPIAGRGLLLEWRLRRPTLSGWSIILQMETKILPILFD